MATQRPGARKTETPRERQKKSRAERIIVGRAMEYDPEHEHAPDEAELRARLPVGPRLFEAEAEARNAEREWKDLEALTDLLFDDGGRPLPWPKDRNVRAKATLLVRRMYADADEAEAVLKKLSQ
jgi:hypothetical protein